MTFSVDVDIIDTVPYSWSFVQAEGQVADGVYVLDGLSFGWDMPKGLWPAQPNPMAAALAINVPDFSGVAIFEGQFLSIEVKADTAGPVIASFYGRITDARAVPREGDLPGVTLSLIAVDYTVDLAELRPIPFAPGTFPDLGDVEELDAVTQAWLHFDGTGISDLWSASSLRFLNAVNPDAIIDFQKYVAALLTQAVNVGAGYRMIVSPNIASDGTLAAAPSGRFYTLDTISNDTEIDTTPFEVPASAVLMDSVDWRNTKGQAPRYIYATGWGGDPANAVFSEVVTPWGDTLTITVDLLEEADAQDTVDFYAANSWARWQLSACTVAVSAAGIGADVPLGLFPDWKADELEPERAACYNRRIQFTGVDTTRTPDGEPLIDGVLVGSTCRIEGGELSLDLSVRLPVPEVPA